MHLQDEKMMFGYGVVYFSKHCFRIQEKAIEAFRRMYEKA